MSYIQHTAHCCLVSTLFTDLSRGSCSWPLKRFLLAYTEWLPGAWLDYAAPSVWYIKRIVRAVDCLVVIYSEVVSCYTGSSNQGSWVRFKKAIGISLSSPLSRNNKINNSSWTKMFWLRESMVSLLMKKGFSRVWQHILSGCQVCDRRI